MKHFCLIFTLIFTIFQPLSAAELQAQIAAAKQKAQSAQTTLEMTESISELISLQERLFSQEDLAALNELFDVATKVRGGYSPCLGSVEWPRRLSTYEYVLEEFFNPAPKPESDYEAKLRYFEYWRYLTPLSYRLYDEFNAASKRACAVWSKHFKTLASKSAAGKSASKLCELYVQKFGAYAFGEISAPFRMLDKRFEQFLSLEANEAMSFLLINKFSEFELEQLLKMSLLAHHDLSVIKLLLESGASVNSGNESALFYALDYPLARQLLLEFGAQINYANAFNKTALFYAVESNDLALAKWLLDNGADANIALLNTNKTQPFYIDDCAFIEQGKTPLMQASQSADIAMLKLLLLHGAKAQEIDANGQNALDYAHWANKPQNEEFLKQFINTIENKGTKEPK